MPQLDCGSGQLAAVTSGNPLIDAETSESYTLGAVWEPIRGTSVGIDYWNFKVKNQITASVPQAVINNPGGFPSAQIYRSLTDQLPGVPDSGTILLGVRAVHQREHDQDRRYRHRRPDPVDRRRPRPLHAGHQLDAHLQLQAHAG